MNRILIISDLQKQLKSDGMEYTKCLEFVNSKSKEYDVVFATVFSQKVCGELNTNFKSKLNWNECENCDVSDLEFNTSNMQVLIHNDYGCRDFIPRFGTSIRQEDEIDIVGCDLDACVMALCFQLWNANLNFKVLTEYCYTGAKDFSKDDAIKILKRNFGNCVV